MTIKKAADHAEDLGGFLAKYKYQPNLTPVLDARSNAFTQDRINEIVVWKHNRYVEASDGVLNGLNEVKSLVPGEHRKATRLLRLLLKLRSCDLAVASTFLRFANPHVFQIMDRHAYRAVYAESYPFNPSAHSKKKTEEKIDIYFKYLDAVRSLCDEKRIEFRHADRILYMFDKASNGTLSEKKSKTATA